MPFTLFLISVILAGYREQSSISDFLYAIFPYFVCAGVIMQWLASQLSEDELSNKA